MSEDARLRLLSEGAAAFNRGDHQAVLAIFHPEVVSYVDQGLMNAGSWQGHDGYLEMIRNWGEAWETVEVEIVAASEPRADAIVAEVFQRAVGAGSGVPVEMTLFWVFEFRDGLVTRFAMYPDRKSALAEG
jgi:ketosteroid isomerase-like protein